MKNLHCNRHLEGYHQDVPSLACSEGLYANRLFHLLFLVTLLLIAISAMQCLLSIPTYAADSTFLETYPFGTGKDLTQSLAVGDMNNDGYLDIIVGNAEHELDLVYLNNGKGEAIPYASFGREGDRTSSIALGDLNDDGYLDIVAGNGGTTRQYNHIYIFEQENGTYNEKPLGTTPDATLRVTVGDVDDNGTLDVIVGNGIYYDSQTQTVVPGEIVFYMNDGNGNFAIGSVFGEGFANPRGIALGDMDDNGTVDIVVGTTNVDTQGFIYLNKDNQFSDLNRVPFGPADIGVSDVAVGDINKDGHLDIVAAEGTYGDHIFTYLNDSQNPSGFYSGQLDCERASRLCCML